VGEGSSRRARAAFITHTAGYLLNAGWPVIVEGILTRSRYGEELRALLAAHRGRTLTYYLDVDLQETFARHAGRPQAAEFSTDQMTEWFVAQDVLDVPGEVVIPQTFSLADTVNKISRDARLPTRTP
jgi:hypothetical protein